MKKVDQKAQERSKKVVRFILFVLLLTGVILGTVAVSGIYLVKAKVKESVSLMQTIDKEEIKEMTNENLGEETTAKLRDSWTIAALGLDSRDSDGLFEANSDVIMLISMNGKTGEIKLVSVYRDTCLKTGNGKYRKANSAYASGGPRHADAINLIGGVDLDITEKEYKYINSFITETVNTTGIPSMHINRAGDNHLDGVQAVAYCRLRLMDDDFMRTKRQQKVMELVMEKAAHADYATLNQLIEVILPQTAPSIDAEDLYAVAYNIMKFQKPEATGFPSVNYCKTVNGASFVFADSLEDNVKLLHKFLYGSDVFTPSKAVTEISLAIRNKAEGTKTPTTYLEETQVSAPIIEETTPAETVFLNETDAETATSETVYIVEDLNISETVQSPKEGGKPDDYVEQESMYVEEPAGFVKKGPGYEVPAPDMEE